MAQMAEPPRLWEIKLPWETRIIYFVTLCVRDRHEVLANGRVFAAIKTTIDQLRRWDVLAGVVMPDHAHWIVAPQLDREISVGDFANAFKRLLRKNLRDQKWEWQRGCFDRLLLSDENLRNEWIYVQDNPVRDGLVERAELWPYRFDFINNEEGNL